MTKLTKAQRGRLEKLAAYLEGLPEDYDRFDMKWYYRQGESARAAEVYGRENGGIDCGSVACAVGHGPAAGILVPPRLISYGVVCWGCYSELFVGNSYGAACMWLFMGRWKLCDNTHFGAAARIRYLLERGSPPDGFDAPARKYVPLYRPYRIDAKVPA